MRVQEISTPWNTGQTRASGISGAVHVADEELWAAHAVRAASGAAFEPFDCDGRQRAVDFVLTFDDGRTGALEVTSHAEAGSRQVGALLAKDRFVWPNPGNWPWHIAFDPQANVRRVRETYEYVFTTCEAHGARRPDELSDDLIMNDDVLFSAAYESSTSGSPDTPTWTERQSPSVSCRAPSQEASTST